MSAAQRGAYKNHRYFHYTVYQNPLLNEDDVDEVESDKEVMPESAWRRMYLAEFSLSGILFKHRGMYRGDLLDAPLPGKELCRKDLTLVSAVTSRFLL